MRALAALLIASTWACTESPPDVPAACGVEQRLSMSVRYRRAVDVLIVVDRSPSMADQDDGLRATLRGFGAALATVDDVTPDLQLAVVTSDVGAIGVPGCTPQGDGGAFVDATCCGIDGAFLRDDAQGDRNHAGDLVAALGCLAELPLSSCPVSQPLAAAVAALDGSAAGNTGFRRSFADLMVIVISDGDDCSLVDPSALAGVAGEAAVDYACHALGAGLADVDATLRHLGAAVDPAQHLYLSTITGGPDVRIGPGPSLEPVCDLHGVVGPAPRLGHAQLPDRTSHVDMCAATWVDALSALFVHAPVGYADCIDDRIDQAPDVPGVQAECTSSFVGPGPDGLDQPLALVPWCSQPGLAPDAPCLRFADPRGCAADQRRVVLEHPPRSLPTGTWVELRCAAPCP